MKIVYKSKLKNLLVLIVILLLQHSEVSGQVTITGPNCVIPGSPYQYSLVGNWTSTSVMQVCITGGRLIDSSTCTSDTGRFTSVLVVWNDSAIKKIDITSSLGSASFPVETTSNLSGGLINEDERVKVYDSTVIRYVFHCSDPTGGTCQPIYQFQWQRSDNGLNWVNIQGATSAALDFSSTVLVNTYFRRVTSENTSKSVAYTDNALLVVSFNQ